MYRFLILYLLLEIAILLIIDNNIKVQRIACAVMFHSLWDSPEQYYKCIYKVCCL